MTSVNSRVGGCQCGSIRYQINGEAFMLYACHCTDCQKQSSSAFGMSLIVDASQIEMLKGQDRLQHWDTPGDDGSIKRCAFCPDCGSRLFHGGEGRVSIKAGSLDDTSGLVPVAHVWLRSAQAWTTIDRERFLCFDREPDDEAELERRWRERIG